MSATITTEQPSSSCIRRHQVSDAKHIITLSDGCLRSSNWLAGDNRLSIIKKLFLQTCGGKLAIFAKSNGKNTSNVRGGLKGTIECGAGTWNSEHLTMDVPESVLVAEGSPIHADTIWTPGAKTVMVAPKLENDAMTLLSSMAPTVIATGTRAGE